MIRFDVFGRIVGVVRESAGWQAYYLGEDGKRAMARDLTIPPDLPEADLGRHLADIAHERASPQRPAVRRLDSV